MIDNTDKTWLKHDKQLFFVSTASGSVRFSYIFINIVKTWTCPKNLSLQSLDQQTMTIGQKFEQLTAPCQVCIFYERAVAAWAENAELEQGMVRLEIGWPW